MTVLPTGVALMAGAAIAYLQQAAGKKIRPHVDIRAKVIHAR